MNDRVKLEDMKVELMDWMVNGGDLKTVNVARCSFNKYKEHYDDERDTRLIRYLARHGHWTPLAHSYLSFRITAPIFVARQLVKHQVGLVWNEVSRRYVTEEPSIYLPRYWRKKAENVKQGSSNETYDLCEFEHPNLGDTKINLWRWLYEHCASAVDYYNQLLDLGIAPEMARMILPQNIMTTWWWTGSLVAFARVVKQRTDSHAQYETRQIAHMIDMEIRTKLPSHKYSWEALLNESTQ